MEDVEDMLNVTEDDKLYWIGALTYPVWMWTYDNTSMYTYRGYGPLPGNSDLPHTIDGNSALKCHQSCTNDHMFGLMGDKCYCLSTSMNVDRANKQENRCPGNFDEHCGNESGISVYETENVTIVPSGQCIYAKKHSGSGFEFIGDPHCSTGRSMAGSKKDLNESECSETQNVCVTHGCKAWDEWNNMSKLLKVTHSNIRDLKDIMEIYDVPNWHTYWIGLRRFLVSKWLNENTVSHDLIPQYILTGESCLATYKPSGITPPRLNYTWIPCREIYYGLCETVENVQTTTPLYYSSTQTHGSSHSTETDADITSVAGELQTYSTQRSTSPAGSSSNSSLQQTPEYNTETGVNRRTNTGLYLGTSFGCLAVLGMVMVMMIMYRQRQFCFGSKQTATNMDNGVQFNTNPGTGNNLSSKHKTKNKIPKQTVVSTEHISPVLNPKDLPLLHIRNDQTIRQENVKNNLCQRNVRLCTASDFAVQSDVTDSGNIYCEISDASDPNGNAVPDGETAASSDFYNWMGVGYDSRVDRTPNPVKGENNGSTQGQNYDSETTSDNAETDYNATNYTRTSHFVNSYDHIGHSKTESIKLRDRVSGKGLTTNRADVYDHVKPVKADSRELTEDSYSHIKSLNPDCDEAEYDVVDRGERRQADDTYNRVVQADDTLFSESNADDSIRDTYCQTLDNVEESNIYTLANMISEI